MWCLGLAGVHRLVLTSKISHKWKLLQLVSTQATFTDASCPTAGAEATFTYMIRRPWWCTAIECFLPLTAHISGCHVNLCWTSWDSFWNSPSKGSLRFVKVICLSPSKDMSVVVYLRWFQPFMDHTHIVLSYLISTATQHCYIAGSWISEEFFFPFCTIVILKERVEYCLPAYKGRSATYSLQFINFYKGHVKLQSLSELSCPLLGDCCLRCLFSSLIVYGYTSSNQISPLPTHGIWWAECDILLPSMDKMFSFLYDLPDIYYFLTEKKENWVYWMQPAL